MIKITILIAQTPMGNVEVQGMHSIKDPVTSLESEYMHAINKAAEAAVTEIAKKHEVQLVDILENKG